MARSTKATDWKSFGICQMGGGSGGGGGLYFYQFKSDTANINDTFIFVGGGMAGGGSIGGSFFPSIRDIIHNTPPDLYSALHCDQPFSSDDLHLSGGRITSAGAGLALGYGGTFISGYPIISLFNAYFHSQFSHGISVGVGASIVVFIGSWIRI